MFCEQSGMMHTSTWWT